MNNEDQTTDVKLADEVKKDLHEPALTKRVAADISQFAMIRRVSAYVTIISAILFALISVLAIWSVFGDNTGDVVWRAASSLGVIGFAALIVSVVSKSMEERIHR